MKGLNQIHCLHRKQEDTGIHSGWEEFLQTEPGNRVPPTVLFCDSRCMTHAHGMAAVPLNSTSVFQAAKGKGEGPKECAR